MMTPPLCPGVTLDRRMDFRKFPQGEPARADGERLEAQFSK